MTNEYNGYPIVNEERRLIGLISRHFLIVLLKKQCWKDRGQINLRLSEGTASQRNSDVSQERIIDSDENRGKQKKAVFDV